MSKKNVVGRSVRGVFRGMPMQGNEHGPQGEHPHMGSAGFIRRLSSPRCIYVNFRKIRILCHNDCKETKDRELAHNNFSSFSALMSVLKTSANGYST